MSRYESRVGKIECDITTFWMLSRMSWVGTKLYNTALYHARDAWENTGKIPTSFDLQKPVFASYYHDFLPAHTYQHPAHEVWMAFRSWFKLRKKDKTAHPPGFRSKHKLSALTFTKYGFKVIDNDCILLTLGKKLKKQIEYTNSRLPLHIIWGTPFPDDGEIKQIEIIPRKGFFEIHAKIALPEPKWKMEGQIVAVDLGMRNPIVSIGEDGQIDIFKGGEILSHLQYYNKEKARITAEVMYRTKGKKKWSKSLSRMSKRGSKQVGQSIHAMTSAFTEMCQERDVKEVVVGDLKDIKKEKEGTGKKWNKKANQNWQKFPMRKVVAQLRYKLARYGIRLSEQDERGTSKGRCSLCGCMDSSKLVRIHRGLFLCKDCGKYQNADVNGARNQLCRYLHQLGIMPSEGSSGCLAQPRVWRWDNHLWTVVG